MLYTNGKKVNRLQNCMHAFYFECKHIKEAIEQYEFLLNSRDEDLNNIMDKYSKLLFSSIESMRYRIIIGLGTIIDSDKKALSFSKIMNMAEQEGNKKINEIVKKTRKDIINFEELINNIKLLRDKMFAHIDIEYSLEEEEIFDINFEFLDEQINNAKKLLKYVMEVCVLISKEYDNDGIHLTVNWMFDK